MLSINGKTFMNISEAVQWLLANNALPFQSTASFAPDTEIAKSTIINPSPAEIKIGSLVLFADGKVGTVSGITANGFMVGSDSTDLADGVPHITNVQIDASNHLIITMSEGDPIDAGLIKEVSSMSIDASQHLIVHYNDGTTNDLGAIFQGNVNIAGNFTADSIIENMSGYSVSDISPLLENVYCNVVKNGRKVTFVFAFDLTLTEAITRIELGKILVPQAILDELYTYTLEGISNIISQSITWAAASLTGAPKRVNFFTQKAYNGVWFVIYPSELSLNTKYLCRIEQTFTLGANLAS